MQPLTSIFFKKLQLKTSQSVGENSVKKNPAKWRDSQGLSFSLFLIFHFRQLFFQRVNR